MRSHETTSVVLLLAILCSSGAPGTVRAAEEAEAEDGATPSGGGDSSAGDSSADGTTSPDDRATAGTPADWTNDGQFWVIDFEPVCLRMISPSKVAGTSVTNWHRVLYPEAYQGKDSSKATEGAESGVAPSKARVGGDPGRVCWYMVYTLHNSTAEDREIFVNVAAISDGKRQYSDAYLPLVEKAIEKKEKGPLWGKSDEFDELSKRDPKDPKYHYTTLPAKSKRRCVAVFQPIDPNASKILVRVTGLSNEILRLNKDDGTVELQDRVLELRYERPGDEAAVSLDGFKLVGKDWAKRKMALVTSVGVGEP